VDVWEAIEIHHTGEKGTYMYIAPFEKVDKEWLETILPNAKCGKWPQNHAWEIRSLSHTRREFWVLLNALMQEGWEPFSWRSKFDFRLPAEITVVLRRHWTR
jgi:hypothetical protein